MNKKLFLLYIFCFPLLSYGQYTDVINSNRPGFSESPYSVGTGIYQFESSIFNTKITDTPTINSASALGLGLAFRTSFFLEKLEFNLNTALQRDAISYNDNLQTTYDKTGLSQLTLGAKYLVFIPTYKDKTKIIRSWKERTAFDWNRWIPHIGVYAGINFGSALTAIHERGGVTPKIGILLQNEFSHQLNVISNVYYNYIGSGDPEWNYIITGTYNFTDEWSGYAEYQGISSKITPTNNHLGIGAAYLFNENLQLNASARAIFQEKSVGYYGSIGASYRINNHKDKFVALDEYGNKIEEDKPIKYTENKGFFGRLFDKLFKKKDTNKKAETEEGEEINTPKSNGRTRPKSILDDLAKNDQKLKKQTKKEKEKEAKRTQKEQEKLRRQEEKDRLREEKERLKEEKERLKEEEKLRKEEEKLQKELEKERLKEQEKQLKEDEKIRKEEEKIENEIKELEEELKKEKDENKTPKEDG